MKTFKDNDQHMGAAIQVTALLCVFLGMVIGHWIFGQLLIGLITGFMLFAVLLIAHISGKVRS